MSILRPALLALPFTMPWVYHETKPVSKIVSDSHCDYVVGNNAFIRSVRGMRANVVQSIGRDRRELGQYVRSKLGAMLVNLYRSAGKMEEQERRFRSDQHRQLVYERGMVIT